MHKFNGYTYSVYKSNPKDTNVLHIHLTKEHLSKQNKEILELNINNNTKINTKRVLQNFKALY